MLDFTEPELCPVDKAQRILRYLSPKNGDFPVDNIDDLVVGY